MTDAHDDDSAFVRELLAFLDGSDASVDETVVAGPVPPPPARPRRAIRSAARIKRALSEARAEVAALTDQLQQLRDAHGAESVAAKALALAERSKRKRVEQECHALREAVFRQRRFIRGLRSVFSGTPRFSTSLDLCRCLHRHTRLARNRTMRWSEFDQQMHDARLHAAMELLCHETETMTLSADQPEAQSGSLEHTPLIKGETTDTGDCFTTTSMSVYAVDSADLSAVVRATCVAVRGVATLCVSGHPRQVSRDIIDVDASPATNLLYRVMAVNHPCAGLETDLAIETHALTTYKITDSYGIVLWDFVDADELHPTPDATNVSREVTGACLIRREWCDDGVERTVVRTLSTKKLRLLNKELANKLCGIACFTNPMTRVRGHEMLFRRVVMDQLAAEEAISLQYT